MENDNKHNSDIARLLEKLYSPSEPERELAKRQIIALGADAAAPLIAFLRDLASNHIPIFPTGQEQQGQAAIEAHCSFLEREGVEFPNILQAFKRLEKFIINDRLRRDVIFILGEIKSEEAIQFLIKIMEYNGLMGPGRENYGDEMQALEATGLVAIPYLINSIREIESKVRLGSIETLNFSYDFDCKRPEEPRIKRTVDKEKLQLLLKNIDWEKITQSNVHVIQRKTLLIFRRMKDPRTLPYLEELLKETTDETLISYIETTIADIKAPPQTIPPGHIGFKKSW